MADQTAETTIFDGGFYLCGYAGKVQLFPYAPRRVTWKGAGVYEAGVSP